MLSQRVVESVVGLFVLLALSLLLFLAIKVSGLTNLWNSDGYQITASFDDIGQLKVRSAVKIGGVTVGEVTGIKLEPSSYKADVTMKIQSKINDIPDDSSAAILTAGLLGDNYVAITPMYSSNYLKNGGMLKETHSAMVLEKLIGQFLFKVNGNSKSSNSTMTEAKSTGESR